MMPQQPQQQQLAPPDGLIAAGARAGFAGIEQQLSQVMQMFAAAYQVVQKKMPPPPSDPAIEMTYKAAMAEVERKKAVDEASHALKVQEAQQAPMLEDMRQKFEAQLELEQMRRKELAEQFAAQVDLLKNEQDNRQHQITELLKNRDDNETKRLIAELQSKVSSVEASKEKAPAPVLNFDVSEALQQALKPYAEGLGAVHQSVNSLGESLSKMMEGQSSHQQRIMDLAQQLMQE